MQGLHSFHLVSGNLSLSYFLKIFIYLAAPGLSFGARDLCCGTQDLQLQPAEFSVTACGI